MLTQKDLVYLCWEVPLTLALYFGLALMIFPFQSLTSPYGLIACSCSGVLLTGLVIWFKIQRRRRLNAGNPIRLRTSGENRLIKALSSPAAMVVYGLISACIFALKRFFEAI